MNNESRASFLMISHRLLHPNWCVAEFRQILVPLSVHLSGAAMPSRKKPDGTYQDIAHPINNEMRDKLEQMVISEYERVRSGQVVGA